ncbi:MAG: hypothetical protein AABY16_00015 [Nanoarchaeota archaeon]
MNETQKDLTPQQIRAIEIAIKLGRTLQQNHPEIVDLYRQGFFLPQIVEQLDIVSEYRVTENVALSGVGYAISGNNSLFGKIFYDGLIPEEERKELETEHKFEWGKIIGSRTYEQRKGVHARTKEEMIKHGRMGGKIGGSKSYGEGKGVHGMTTEQKEEASSKGGQISYLEGKGVHGMTTEQRQEIAHKLHEQRKGIHALTTEERQQRGRLASISRGETPWSEEEKREAYRLYLSPDYRYQTGNYKGKPMIEKILGTLNKKYHGGNPVRKKSTINQMLHIYKKSLEERAQDSN